jgi:hypothetical protein
MVADARLAAADLTAAIRDLATPARLEEIAEERTARTRACSTQMREFRSEHRARKRAAHLERIGRAAAHPDDPAPGVAGPRHRSDQSRQ